MSRLGRVMLLVMLAVTTANGSASDGVLFQDDFSTGMGAWELDSPSCWFVLDGWLDVSIPSTPYTFAKAFAGNVGWTDYQFEFDLLGVRGPNKICYFRYQGETSGYMLNFRGPVPAEGDPGALRLFRLCADPVSQWPWGCWNLLEAVPYPHDAGIRYHISVEAAGPEITISVDGVVVLDYTDITAPVRHGRIGLAGFTGGDSEGGTRCGGTTSSRRHSPQLLLRRRRVVG